MGLPIMSALSCTHVLDFAPPPVIRMDRIGIPACSNNSTFSFISNVTPSKMALTISALVVSSVSPNRTPFACISK